MGGKLSITDNLRKFGLRVMLITGAAWILCILILDSLDDPTGVLVAMLGLLVIFLPAGTLIGLIALLVGAALADHKA